MKEDIRARVDDPGWEPAQASSGDVREGAVNLRVAAMRMVRALDRWDHDDSTEAGQEYEAAHAVLRSTLGMENPPPRPQLSQSSHECGVPFPDVTATEEAGQLSLRREVSVSSLADRHAEDHSRAFAETRSTTVPADGDLREVVDAALAEVEFTAGGRFVIMVSEPHETEQGGTEK